jgi:hypothetical protein
LGKEGEFWDGGGRIMRWAIERRGVGVDLSLEWERMNKLRRMRSKEFAYEEERLGLEARQR